MKQKNFSVWGFLNKNKEMVMYLICGGLTTLVSILSYYLSTVLFFNPESALNIQISNIISWILSVSFAFITNRLFVFKSRGKISSEAFRFYISRLGTLGFEMLLMYVLVTLLCLPDLPVKIAVQFIIILLNYVLSKLLIFKQSSGE